MSASPRRTHRAALIVLVAVASLACLALAWWQWSRFESASGTAQNLGYALQWPAFSVAVIYAYRRFVVLEAAPEEERARATRPQGVTEIPDGLLPDRPTTPSASSLSRPKDYAGDTVLAEYNRYLADLDARERSAHDDEFAQPGEARRASQRGTL